MCHTSRDSAVAECLLVLVINELTIVIWLFYILPRKLFSMPNGSSVSNKSGCAPVWSPRVCLIEKMLFRFSRQWHALVFCFFCFSFFQIPVNCQIYVQLLLSNRYYFYPVIRACDVISSFSKKTCQTIKLFVRDP